MQLQSHAEIDLIFSFRLAVRIAICNLYCTCYRGRRNPRITLACNKFGLTISTENSAILCHDASQPPTISLVEQPPGVVKMSCYLLSTFTNKLSLDDELKASTIFSRQNATGTTRNLQKKRKKNLSIRHASRHHPSRVFTKDILV